MPDNNLRTCTAVPGRSDLSAFQKSWTSQFEAGHVTCDLETTTSLVELGRTQDENSFKASTTLSTAVFALSETPKQRVAEFNSGRSGDLAGDLLVWRRREKLQSGKASSHTRQRQHDVSHSRALDHATFCSFTFPVAANCAVICERPCVCRLTSDLELRPG
jgi:hypothetical protein